MISFTPKKKRGRKGEGVNYGHSEGRLPFGYLLWQNVYDIMEQIIRVKDDKVFPVVLIGSILFPFLFFSFFSLFFHFFYFFFFFNLFFSFFYIS
jgi:hypothetical protein